MIPLPSILRAVSLYYDMDERDIVSPARFRERVIVRQVYVYLARVLTPHGYKEISPLINRDRSTIFDNMTTFKHRIATDAGLRDDIAYLLAVLRNEPTEIRKRGIPTEWYSNAARMG